MTKISLDGDGPFFLPIAQRAKAQADTKNGVTISLVCLRDNSESVTVSVQMTSNVARQLASQLMLETNKAEPKH